MGMNHAKQPLSIDVTMIDIRTKCHCGRLTQICNKELVSIKTLVNHDERKISDHWFPRGRSKNWKKCTKLPITPSEIGVCIILNLTNLVEVQEIQSKSIHPFKI